MLRLRQVGGKRKTKRVGKGVQQRSEEEAAAAAAGRRKPSKKQARCAAGSDASRLLSRTPTVLDHHLARWLAMKKNSTAKMGTCQGYG